MANAPERQPFANDPASKPSQPGKPTAADITHNTIHLIWERPQFGFENVTSYMVHYRQVSGTAKQWTHLKTLAKLNHIPITQLAPSTKYLFKVCAVCEAGHGPDSEMSDPIATSPPPAPGKAGKPTATNVTYNSVELSWSCPESGTINIKYYSVLFRRTDNPSECWQTRRTESAQPCLVVSGLAANAVYCFKVRAQCEGVACSDSEMSEPIATRPERPSKPKASKVTHNSIQISWSNPDATSQDIKFCSVMYRKINDPLSQWMTQSTLDTEEVATVNGLDAKTLYCFKVRVEGENGECCESEVSDLIATSPLSILMPEKPGQPVAIQVTHNSVHLTWSSPELGTHSIKFYSVLYRRMDDPSSQWQTHITPDAQEVATVSGLAAKAMYCFKVRAECEGDVCSESEVSDFIATNAQPIPGKPGKPTPTKVTHNSIQLIWSRSESGIQDVKCYSVLYRQMDDPSSQWQTQNIPDVLQVTTKVRGLTANAVYCLKVRAVGEDGGYSESEMSDPVATSPHPLPAKPGQPIVTKVTHNSVQLTWSGPEAGTHDVMSYSVVYRKMDDRSSQWQTQITPHDNEVTVNSLAVNAVYCFKIRAVGEDGVYSESEMSDPVATSSHPLPGKPGQPMATQVTHNSAQLTWSSPELGTHNIKFYSVLYRRIDDPSSQWQTQITQDAQEVVTVSGLAVNAMYCFKVRAECEGDVCSESEVSDFIATNAQPVPGKPGQPIISEVSHNSMQLKWARPESGSEGIKCYTVLYRRMDNPSSQWQLQNTQDAQEVAIVSGLAANVLYCFKVRAECEAGVSVESEMSDPVATRPSPSSSHPGTHKVANTNMTHNIGTDIIPQTKVNSEKETYPFESLIPDQPSCININSEVSTFRTKMKGRLAEGMLSSAQLIEQGPPAIYKLKVQNVAIDEDNQLKKCAIGHADPLRSADEKVILVLGATGAGKTTLINGMANYLLGVQWEDEFRFQVVTDETDDDTSQAHSQTKWITAYTFHHQKGSPLPYTLTLIDTPGFGDTRGLERDHYITEQIKHFFSASPPVGIDHLNAIGFVTQAVLARLSPTQKYIFDSILAIFDKDIASNIFMMATFADGGDPPVLAAIKEANIPFCDLFKFNNSSLYANCHGDMFSKMFWEMGVTSFETFFAHLTTVEARSLRLTRVVLDEREHFEAIIQGLLPQIKYIMSTMDRLQQEEKVLERLQLESSDLGSKEFTYTVTAIHQRRIDLPTGEYITNCTKCNFTCHYPCKISDDANKWRCAAMNWKEAGEKSVCQVCPRGCEWHNHCNNTFRIETFEEQEKRILDDMLKRLKVVAGDKNAVETGVYRIQQKVRNLKRKVFEMICEAHQILARLDEIALKPNPLTELDYIDLLIESEKQECKLGYMKRLEYLQEFRQYAELIHQSDDSVDTPQWLKESVQKARERMLRRIHLFQQQGSNVHPHHTQGQLPPITVHEFSTREQTFKHQQSSQSQHTSFKPTHAQPPKVARQEALMYQISGHQHSSQWLNSNPSSDPAHAQPPRVDGREASTGQEHTAMFCPNNQINISIATNSQTVPRKPGQPIVSEVSHNSMQLKWARPESGSEGIKCYTVLYRRMDNPSSQWQLQNTQDAQEVAIVNGLAANVLYCFKVRAECEAGVSVESEMSDPVATRPSPSSSHPGTHKHNTDADITPQSKVRCNRQTYPRETLPPSQCSKPQILPLSHDTVLLNWNQPSCGIQDTKYYTVSYYVVEDHDFPDKWKTQRTEGPTESVRVTGLNPNAVYCFKVRADSDTGCSSYSESSDPIQLHAPSAPSPPGKPTATDNDVIHNRILLNWGKPRQGGDYVKRYCISYRRRHDPPDQWQTRLSDGARTTLAVSGLDPKTEYCFKVHAVSDYGTSNPSNVSTFETKTKGRLAEDMLSSAQLIEKGPPAVYKLKVQNVAVDKDNQLTKYVIGHADPLRSADEKVILVLGATGAGKTTLINGMANYFLGVRWEDEFRFQVVTDETDDDTSQAHSQTKWITAYTFHHQKGSPLPYTLTLIDTPGFGDTGGLQRDHRITEQIKHFFSAPPPVGIDHLNAIGFVTQAALARLTPTQKYIFDSILAIFGKDIASNIFMMATFADGGDPPVLAAIKEVNIPFCDLFKFNNSSLYASCHGGMFSQLFWEMGVTSFETFFAHLTTVEARSLRLTSVVLDEREHLEAIIQGFLPQIKYIMSTMDRLQQEEKVLERLQLESSDLWSKEFTYTVIAIYQRQIDLPTGEYITNCTKCNFTCHYPCKVSDNANKWRCAVMNWREYGEKSVCQVCPRGCEWHNHCNNTFRIEYFEEQEERILDDLLKRFKIVEGDKNAVKTAVYKIQQRVRNFKMRVFEMISEAHQILARLDEIALKPNPLTELDYIDLLIESEKQECKLGYMKRLEYLQEFRQYAELIHQSDDSVDTPQWLKESVQKVRERMLRRIHLFQQQGSNVHPHHTQGQLPPITAHEFSTREQTFKHQQSSQSQHTSFKPTHAQPPRTARQEALMRHMSGHQHSSQWQHPSQYSPSMYVQPSLKTKEGSTADQLARHKQRLQPSTPHANPTHIQSPKTTRCEVSTREQIDRYHPHLQRKHSNPIPGQLPSKASTNRASTSKEQASRHQHPSQPQHTKIYPTLEDPLSTNQSTSRWWPF